MGVLAGQVDVLEIACVSCALSIVEIATYWSSRCSAIRWSIVLQAVTKRRPRGSSQGNDF